MQINNNTVKKITDLEPSYNMFFFDIWGVVFDRDTDTTADIVEVVNFLLKKNKIHFISNSPDLSQRIAMVLRDKMMNVDIKNVTTAGQVSYDFLHNVEKFKNIISFDKFPKLEEGQGIKAFVLNNSAKKNANFWFRDSEKIQEVNDINDADCLIISMHSYIDESSADLMQEVNNVLTQSVAMGVPAICSNPDRHFLAGNKLFYCPGYFANQYEQMGGSVLYIGKPHLPIYEYAFDYVKVNSKDNKILMVGDTLTTDIKGGLNSCIDTGLVLTGNAGQKSLSDKISNSEIESIAAIKLDCQLQNIFPDHFVSVA